MKNGTKIALAIGIILLAVGATIVNIAVGRGDKADFSYGTKDGSVFSGFSVGKGVDQKGYTVCTDGEESFRTSEVRKLDLDWVSGTVTVEAYDGGELIVREKIDGSATEQQRMRWRLSGGELSVLPCADNLTDLPTKHLTVLVPEAMEAEWLNVDVSSAKVTIDGLSLSGEIDVDSASGRVEIANCICRELFIDSASGAQSVTDCVVDGLVESDSASGSFEAIGLSCGALDVDGASGAVRAEDLLCGGSVDIDSGSGSVYLSFGAAPKSVNVDTASGAVTLVFPKGTGIDLHYDSASGKLSGELSAGKLSVDVDTVSGDLRIEYR